MKKHPLLLLFVLVGITIQAQIPNGYYNTATGKTGNELKSALHEIIKDHSTISYGQIWNAFWSTDNKGNGVVWDMYSDVPNGTPPYTYTMVENQCGSYDAEGDCYNREHVWAQSWFGNQATPSTDLHHIFATDGFVNQQRSNYPFGKVKLATWTSQNGSKLGSCESSLGYSGTVFEPIDAYKGDIARALLYMSVRYYSEDADWGTSEMTNKSEIKDWAINMLLEWNEQDPVSQKEINRNNVIYNDYQGNRNPFIDHPEYARAIWDPDWNGVEYNITYASIQHGSVTGPSTATQGSNVTITAIPSEGYMLGTLTVYKTGEQSTTIAVNSDGSFTMPAFNVTVSATFVANNNLYDISCASVQHGTISTNVSSAKSGTTIQLTATPSTGYALYSWYVFKTGDMNTMVYSGSGSSFTMPAFAVTVMATFAPSADNGDYVKVTTNLSDWSGEYLIVYEAGNKAFNGGLSTLDAVNNYIEVTIDNDKIASSETTDAAFTIAKSGNSYTIKSASGYFIGQNSNSNGLQSSNTTTYTNNITYNTDNEVVDIIGFGGAYLRYNTNSNQNRFRFFKSDTYTNQQAIQLYKKASGIAGIPTHTIHYEPNGTSGTMPDQTINEFEPTQLNDVLFERIGYEFVGWNTHSDGTGQYYANGATVSLLDDLTLYAQWEQLFSITLSGIMNGTVTVSETQAIEGSLINLKATPDAGYEFDQWTITDASNSPISVVDNQFEMPASNVNVNASFVYVGQYEQKYYLVTDASQLEAGRTYLIVNTNAQTALGTTQNNNNRSGTEVSITNNVIAEISNTVCELSLGGESDAWTFFDSNWGENGGYLYASSSNSNQLKTQATNNENSQWKISIESNGTASIIAQGNNTRNDLRYNPNNGSPIFSCYASTSNMANVELYVRGEEFVHTESATLVCLNTFDKHTIQSGVALTVNQVFGMSQCNEAGNLILEDGAQFVHNVDGMKATMKKNIETYVGNGGWYTIATPFTSFSPEGTMISDDYDLYAYNEAGNSEGMEWINYKTGAFNLQSNTGYLFAHQPSVTLRLTGTLNNSNYSQSVELGYANNDEDIKGFNLLGNPTAHEISFTKTDQVSDGYYYLDNDETWTYSTSNTVPFGRGFLVKANADGQSVTLNPQSKRGESEKGQYLCLDIDGEKAYVKMNKGVSMPLINLNGKSSTLNFSYEGKPYIMLVKDEADMLNLNYKPRQTGWHQLSFTAGDASVDYLHLIDRLTGADIDLLTTPSYQFVSSESDYAARFELRFTESDNTSHQFAIYSDGNIIVSCDGNATLQFVDALGRIVSSYNIQGTERLDFNANAGVYLLKLIKGNELKTQKIIIW